MLYVTLVLYVKARYDNDNNNNNINVRQSYGTLPADSRSAYSIIFLLAFTLRRLRPFDLLQLCYTPAAEKSVLLVLRCGCTHPIVH